MKEEWLLAGAAVPVTCETVTAHDNQRSLVDNQRILELEALLERQTALLEHQTARIVDLQTHIDNLEGEDR